MPGPPPPEAVTSATASWSQLVQPALVTATVAILSFITAYFMRRKDTLAPETPAGDVVNNSLGAAFMDKAAGPALLRIDQNVQKLVDFAIARNDREHDKELLQQAAEQLRRELEQQRDKPAPRAR